MVFELTEGEMVKWQGVFNISQLQCTRETVTRIDNGRNEFLFTLKEKRYSAFGSPEVAVQFTYEGSMLSQVPIFSGESADSPIQRMKQEITQLKSLELLAPNLMRKRSRAAVDIGGGGEELSGFVSSLPVQTRREIAEILHGFYPRFTSFDVAALRSGWQNLSLTEDYQGNDYASIKSDVWHINDGFLRLLAIVSQTKTTNSILLFDEIENGINPELVERLVDHLVGCGKQVVVTTHSPMILNYLDDETARKAVVLIYKEPTGRTGSMRYFDNSETSRKLKLLGPGEVFVDTSVADVLGCLPG